MSLAQRSSQRCVPEGHSQVPRLQVPPSGQSFAVQHKLLAVHSSGQSSPAAAQSAAVIDFPLAGDLPPELEEPPAFAALPALEEPPAIDCPFERVPFAVPIAFVPEPRELDESIPPSSDVGRSDGVSAS